MRYALMQARLAAQRGEVPVGAVAVAGDRLLAVAGNQPIGSLDPTAHAEVLVIRQLARQLQNYRLPGITLYVTLEPCSMCAGAMLHARIERLVYAAADPRTGAAGSVLNLLQQPAFNHQLQVQAGVLSEDSSQLLRQFFKMRRQQGKRSPGSFKLLDGVCG